MNRYKLFDEARGFAIIAMVMANTAPLLAEDVTVPFWFRLFSSFPAPTFVTVAGVMVALTAAKHNFSYFLWRGLFVVGVGAVIDIAANKIVPFQGFDVLYLIGFMTPCAYFASKLKTPQLVATIAVLFALTYVLQYTLSYQELPITTYLSGEVEPEGGAVAVWRHWLIDGWFPLLPWLPLGLCGIFFARYFQTSSKQHALAFCRAPFLASMVGLSGLGLLLSWINQSPYFIRDGYIELFYPPTFGFVVSALAVVGFVLALAELTAQRGSVLWFQLFGSMTLAMYTLHLLIIGHVFSIFFDPIPNFGSFYGIFLVHVAVLAVLARFIKYARETYVGMPVMLKWLVGK